jgi:hypothetical protein
MDNERDYSEFDFDPDIGTHAGFSIGDQVMILEDVDDVGISEGEEGQIIGFSQIPPAEDPAAAMAFGNDPNGRTAIYVLIDGTELPIEIKPSNLEVQ